jgi:aspartate racemase
MLQKNALRANSSCLYVSTVPKERKMKTIGLLGGLGWASTIEYYRMMNQEVNRRLGGHFSARILLYSFDFSEIYELQNQGQHNEVAKLYIKFSKLLQESGADCLLLGANTAHMHADEVQKNLSIPLIHIVDVTAHAIQKAGLKRVGLLGTKFTMQMDFFKERLKKHGIDAIVPDEKDMLEVVRIIKDELYFLNCLPQSKKFFLEVIDRLKDKGAQGVILGCTEIPLLVNSKDHVLPLFDTTQIHAMAAVEAALS